MMFDNLKMYEIIAIVAMVLITLWIFIGNFLVLYAFFSVRQIRTIDNMIIASLSATDFLLSISVAPLAIYNWAAAPEYRIYASCLLWLSSDVFLSTVSIWHLCAISFERFYCVVFPLKFMQNRKKRVKLLISLAWLSGVFITIPLIIMASVDKTTIYQINVSNVTNSSSSININDITNNLTTSIKQENNCNYFNAYYSIISVIFSFWFPMIVMLFLTCFTMIILNRSKYRLKPRNRLKNPINKKRKSVAVMTSSKPLVCETILEKNYENIHTPQKVNFILKERSVFGLSQRFNSIEFIDENVDDDDCEMYTNCPPISKPIFNFDNIESDDYTTTIAERSTIVIDLDTITSKTTTDESVKDYKNNNSGIIKLGDKIANIIKHIKQETSSVGEQTILTSIETKSYSSNGNLIKNNQKVNKIDTVVLAADDVQKPKVITKMLKSLNKNKETVTKTNNNNNTKAGTHSKVTQYVCKESEAQRRSLIVLIAFILGYTPLFTLITISWVSHLQLNSEYFVILTWVGYLSSALNPSLYAWMNRNLKRAFYLIITCKLDRKNSRQNNILFKM